MYWLLYVPTDTSIHWEVTITTSDVEYAANDLSYVYLTMYGADGASSGEMELDNLDKDDFEQGQTDVFHLATEDIGDLDHIVIQTKYGVSDMWRIDSVAVKNLNTSQDFVFNLDWWLNTNRWIDAWTNHTLYPMQGKYILEP